MAAGNTRSLRTSTRETPFVQVKKLLDSKHDREVLDGLRQVVSMIYRKKPCLPYFSSVVKNVASPNIEIKKLVYIYLLHYAESEPDLALLSINTIQKSLTDQNPQVRAMALRVMSGIRVPVISQIVSLAIKRGIGDMSPYVRKAAALAIPKCYRLAPSTLPQLLDYLSILLGDKQYYVVGSAVQAFLEVCPDRIDLIHKHYRGLVRKLVDMDEWGQLATLRLLTIYARRCFPKKTKKVKKTEMSSFYGDESLASNSPIGDLVPDLDRDLELLLSACKPLLSSRNSAVIVAVARTFLHLATPEYLDLAIGPMVALLRTTPEVYQIILHDLVSLCLVRPQAFVPYVGHFLLRSTDAQYIWPLKLEILTLLFPHCDIPIRGLILSELQHFTRSPDDALARESIRAIGRCAQHEAKASPRCLNLLLKQITAGNEHVVEEALTVIRLLIQKDPAAHVRTVIRLAKLLDTMTDPAARANIIWLVGEFAGASDEKDIAPDVLRLLLKGFADESEAAKLQIVLLAARVYLHHLNRTQTNETEKTDRKSPVEIPREEGGFEDTPAKPAIETPEHPISIMWQYVLLLSRYDTSYDLRDRTRLFKALLSDPQSTQLASLILLAPKPVPQAPSPSAGKENLLLGSASLVIGQDAGPTGLSGYEGLPNWVKLGEEPDPKLRDAGQGEAGFGDKKAAPAGDALDRALANKGQAVSKGLEVKFGANKDKSLDDWLAEEESSEEEEEAEESEESSETDEESSEEESSDDEGVGRENRGLMSQV
ncbi:AP-3 complex subunit beta [Agyrium rufum]|nr:AP-3 complex subunit beta [Agyrium rufum]